MTSRQRRSPSTTSRTGWEWPPRRETIDHSDTEVRSARLELIGGCSGGIVPVIGVYGGFVDELPAGSWMNRALTRRTLQCHVQRYIRPLLERIERGEIDHPGDHAPAAAGRGPARPRHRQDQGGRLREVVLTP
jgi:hypothetical protein